VCGVASERYLSNFKKLFNAFEEVSFARLDSREISKLAANPLLHGAPELVQKEAFDANK
jgi:hypothetical protein